MASGLVAELYAKHQNSPQPSSQAVCAVLGASLEVLQAEGLEASPASLFAAVMSSLEKPDGKGPPEVFLPHINLAEGKLHLPPQFLW